MMKATSTDWSWWQRTVWLFTGHAPSPEAWAAAKAEKLAFDVLERELRLIDERAYIEAQKEKINFISTWSLNR